MLLALIGIISVQARWLRQAYELREMEFDRTVQTVLGEVVDGLELEFLQENILQEIVVNHSDSTDDVEVKVSRASASRQQQFRMKISKDSSRKLHEAHQIIRVNSSDTNIDLVEQKTEGRVHVISHVDLDLKDRKELIDKAADRLFIQMLKQPEQQMLNMDVDLLSAKLDSAFQLKGMALDFTLDKESGKLPLQVAGTFVKPVSWISESAEQPYFSLTVHNRESILRNNWLGNFLLALGLTFLLLFVFYDTVKTILKQKRLSEMKNDFINNMTHEFKTPLATVNLALDAIDMPAVSASPEKLNHYLGLIRKENQKMNLQVERVLEAARLNQTDLNLKKSRVEVHQLIKEQLDKYHLSISQAGIKVEFHQSSEQFCVADEFHLGNAIGNLIDNAIKYGKDELHIEVSSKNDCLYIKVKDNGIGMSKEVQQNVFKQFYRRPTGNIHNVKGFGLGLSYVKAVAEAHKGEISLKSKLSEGSTFTLKLCSDEN